LPELKKILSAATVLVTNFYVYNAPADGSILEIVGHAGDPSGLLYDRLICLPPNHPLKKMKGHSHGNSNRCDGLHQLHGL
jgi:hypothetical protein